AYGTSVTLGTTPASHYHLNAYSGDCSGSSCMLSMTANRTVSASFALDQYTLTVNVVGTGTVSFGSVSNCSGPTCTGTFNYGDTPTITQSAGNGYHFSGWGGACTGTGTCAPQITGPTTVNATFTQQVQLSLSTGMGGGTLAPTSPAANGSCGTNCYLFDVN